jgi:ParB family transcriptional regulator, chromosome partitioning protein
VTKDRRLGRGLAALLGSPLDEISTGDPVPTDSSLPNRPAQEPRSMPGRLPTTGQSAPSTQPVQTAQSAAALPIASEVPTLAAGPAGEPRAHAADGSGGAQATRKAVTGSIPLPAATAGGRQSLQISVYEIDNNPFQPRRKFNEEEIASLAASIREHEQLQPILVRRIGDRFQLISGERRLRAAIHAGMKTIRAEVREADDRLVAELAIVENLQRKDLDAIEKALSFRRYIDQHQCTQEDLAKRLKIDRSTIANLMRLLELPEKIQHWIQNEKVTAGHARALLPLGEEEQQLEFARLIQEESWSVRETERRVAAQIASEDGTIEMGTAAQSKSGRKRMTPQLAALEQQLRLALGTKTEIRQNASGSGRIVINFTNSEEFERLCGLICPSFDRQRVA